MIPQLYVVRWYMATNIAAARIASVGKQLAGLNLLVVSAK